MIKRPHTPKDGRFRFVTKDGSLVQDRQSDTSFWNEDFIEMCLRIDAQEKGVRVLDHRREGNVIIATVEYLKGAKS